MNYKEIFKISLLLISSPAKAWEEIRLQEDKRKVFTQYVYPMIGFCALSVFLGSLFANGWGGPESFQIAMTLCCVSAVSLFGGYYLAAYIINEMNVRLFWLDSDRLLVQQFAGYALVVTFLTNIVTGLFPSFGLIAILLQFYILFVIWESAPITLEIPDRIRLKFTVLTSIILVGCPALIQFIFSKLLIFLN